VTAIAAGVRHTCALQALGDVWCWGDNAQWQVGFGAEAISANPNPLQMSPGRRASGIRAIAAGEAHTCIVTDSSEVDCWGSNERGQLGNGTWGGVATTPQPVPLDGPVIAIAAGRQHTCALLAGGVVRCWGAGTTGQLGDDTAEDSLRPVHPKIDPNLEVVVIAAGGDVTCAITEDRALRCWGDNESGQLGDTSNLPRYVPQQVHGLTSNIRTVAVGPSSTCAVTLAGTAYCWGRNDQGQLGDGTNTDRSSPVVVKGL
jgi:alpha-tubulin suppressor-like RCC1 family protein